MKIRRNLINLQFQGTATQKFDDIFVAQNTVCKALPYSGESLYNIYYGAT